MKKSMTVQSNYYCYYLTVDITVL